MSGYACTPSLSRSPLEDEVSLMGESVQFMVAEDEDRAFKIAGIAAVILILYLILDD